jgi:Ca-activated chloride channel family protein
MDFSHPHFAAPAWLWLAVLAPLGFAALCVFAARGRARQLAMMAEVESHALLLRSHSRRRRVFKNILVALVLAGIGAALARPQWGRERSQTVDLQGEDLMLVLDCSKSMLTTDVRPNRLDRAKLAILDFVQSHPGGRVGLVAFAGQAFVQCPLTFDYEAFSECLMAVDAKTIPVQGTDLARALEESLKAMEKSSRRKLLILVTDGEDLEHEGVKKARELAAEGVVVYTVGVGTGEGKQVQVAADNGAGTAVLRDNTGQAVTSRLDENTLRAIAGVTGGDYQPLGSIGQGLARVRDAIQFGSGHGRKESLQAGGIDRFHWFLAAALLAMVVESLIGTRRRMRENAIG